MGKLRFGTAGVPISAKKHSSIEGVKRVRELGLDAMELEFVRGVRMSPELAGEVKGIAGANDVALTCHGPYYINLNSKKEDTVDASRGRILKTARIGSKAGVRSITFHAAFRQDSDPKLLYSKVKGQLEKIMETVRKEKLGIDIRPETVGKVAQFGTLDEIIQLSQDIDGVLPCIDFAHMHASTNGKYNTYDEFREILGKVEEGLGKAALKNMHCHVSGIAYSARGEQNHLILEESDFNYKDLVRAWKDYEIEGIIISESPNLEGDALLLQGEWEKL